MLKVFIVDDDSISRMNIKSLISWEKHGYEICGEAANGASAIQMLEEVCPAIIITDMNMPVMNGVELIEYVYRKHPNIKIIALSGYDDFEYVRQSMRKGAIDYILKHRLNQEVLLKTLENAKEIIYKEMDITTLSNTFNEQNNESLMILRRNFFKKLVQGTVTDRKEIEKMLYELKINIDTKNLALAVAEIDDYHILTNKIATSDMDRIIMSFEDISNEILRDTCRGVVVHIDEGRFLYVFSLGTMRSDALINRCLTDTIERIKNSIKRYLNITACFSISDSFNDICGLSRYHLLTQNALQQKFYNGKNKIIKDSSSHKSQTSVILSLDIREEKAITSAIKSGDRTSLGKALADIFNRLTATRAGSKSIRMICAELIDIINRVCREFGINMGLIYSDEEIPYDEMKKMDTVEDVRQWIYDTFDMLMEIMERLKLNLNYSDTTKMAIEFIYKHYSKGISLSDAAERIGVNSSYLSRIFKKECSMGFVEYLNMVRINQAKHLMQGGHIKLKDIVQRVGFNNYTYFFKVFKEIENMTPSEYEQTYHISM